MSKLTGLIPAAGKGVRARPYTEMIPKGMLDINGVPNIQRNISLMRDDLGIEDICIVVGYLGSQIKDYFGDGRKFNVNIRYIENKFLERGLAFSILLARDYIDDYFCVILSDECYINSNHHELTSFPYKKSLATCGTMSVDDRELIKQNYSVVVDNDRIVRLTEKPCNVTNDIMGSGTFIFSAEIFDFLEKAFSQKKNGFVEFITFLDKLCQTDEQILNFNLTGTYVNINDRNSLNLAKYYERRKQFNQNIISMLVYSEGKEKDIAFTINRYRKLNLIHQIFVILPHDNGIEKIVLECGASSITCPPEVQLYGEKIKYAMGKMPGDIIMLCEADYSFPSRDVVKLLAYLKEADMVVGTRTTRQLIEQGADMRGIVRFANVMLAKLLEILWWNFEGRFTDVGCTFRAIWRSNFNKIKDRLNSKGPEFSAEMIIEVLSSRDRVIEIPVNYFNRSQLMHIKYQNPKTFFRFLFLILKKRLQFFILKKK